MIRLLNSYKSLFLHLALLYLLQKFYLFRARTMSANKRKSTLLSLTSHRSLKTLVSDPIPFKSIYATRELPVISKPLSSRKKSVDSSSLSDHSAEGSLDSPFLNVSVEDCQYTESLYSVPSKFLASTGGCKRSNSRIPRSSHYGNISSFIDGSKTARKSQQQEMDELNISCARISAPGEDLQLHLVENAIFMTFCLKEADRINKRSTRYWDDLDIDEVLRA